MKRNIRALLIEDLPDDAALVKMELHRGGFEVESIVVDNAEAMQKAVAETTFDVVISDYNLPQFTGLQALRIHRDSAGANAPFIIVSGSIGEELAVELMRKGVNDYIMKDNLRRLAPAVERELRDAEEREARRQAEKALKESERMRAVGELTASLVHDLKNPLSSIMMMASLIEQGDHTGGQLADNCQLIIRQVHRIVAMSDDVLEFVRGQMNIQLTDVNPFQLAQEFVNTYEPIFQRDNISLQCIHQSNAGVEPRITADEQKLWRALQNLVVNAKDAMKDGGVVFLRVLNHPDQTLFEVEDTGGGIPGEIRDDLFKPFVTYGKKRGTGLGLAIVKSIVDAHSGSITFQVKENVGTTFRISLPRNHPEQLKAQLKGEPTHSPSSVPH